ncbi:MAG: CoB--CoM heterodisulfide reductase iron-sulfur subunit B family protein [Deltaproteobacteria bacterium]|jgi:heterodisulfide reductase subunit B|nr:CoB--CoM heterodisulfide reductase iron-sulfur subunit B family protein [Deltaproteobacteria bacterium]
MQFALFQGCNIPARVSQYADATEAVCHKLDIELVESDKFNCCGYPVRNIDQRSFVLSAAKNLAVAEMAGLDMLVMCKCCYGSLKKAAYVLGEDQDLKKDINAVLAKEKLHYGGHVGINHLLSVLYHKVGVESLKPLISKTFSGLQIAVSYGCHALRPSIVTGFDDPVSPKIFDELVEITGAFSVEWTRKLDCCGAPLTGINDRLAMDMAAKKIASARDAGAHYLCTACPYTHIQFDWVQNQIAADSDNWEPLAPVLYPQLLGLCMGIDETTLGLSNNRLELGGISSFLMTE